MTKHIKAWKEKQVVELKELIDSNPVIAIASLEGFPASVFQKLRKNLKGKAVIKVSKVRVVKKALEASKIKDSKLKDFTVESVALIATGLNPFELYSLLKKNQGKISAKEGILAPEDILITARDTGLPPGPALSDLKSAGLNARIQGSTIHIMEDKVVTKKGAPVSKAVAGTLNKLGLKPISVRLKVLAVLENKEIFKPEVLDIDIGQVFSNFVKAFKSSLSVALEASYFTKQTVELLVQKAFRNSKAIALEANLLTKATVPSILAKANAQAASLKGLVKKEASQEEAKEEKQEEKIEKPTEEKKKETKEKPKEEKKSEEKKEEKEEKGSKEKTEKEEKKKQK